MERLTDSVRGKAGAPRVLSFGMGPYFGLGLEDRMLAPESGMDLGEGSLHHLHLEGTRAEGRIRPQMRIEVPVDDELGEILSYVIGIGVDVTVR